MEKITHYTFTDDEIELIRLAVENYIIGLERKPWPVVVDDVNTLRGVLFTFETSF